MSITGRYGGSGKYSYREVASQRESVMVTHFPEDGFNVRIAFRNDGETSIPILKIDERLARLLWAALKLTAADLQWDDRMATEKEKPTP